MACLVNVDGDDVYHCSDEHEDEQRDMHNMPKREHPFAGLELRHSARG